MSDCVYNPPNPELETLCRATEAAEKAASAAQALADRSSGVGDWAKLIDVLTGALLPVAAIVFVIYMVRPIRSVIESRKFTIKIAGLELSAQEASDQLREKVDQLARRLAEIEGGDGGPEGGQISEGPASKQTMIPPDTERTSLKPSWRVLWVDDRPTNNAFEVASLISAGYDVQQVTTSRDALNIIEGGGCDVVLSDMGRPEGRDAGLDLLKQLRSGGDQIPFGFYSSRASLRRNAKEIEALGVFVATSEFVDLLKAFRRLPKRDTP